MTPAGPADRPAAENGGGATAPAAPERSPRRPFAPRTPWKEPYRRLRRHAFRSLGASLAALVSRLSYPAAQRLGRALGTLLWHLSRKDRRRALDGLATAFPELSPGERERLARSSFRHQGTSIGECLNALGWSCREVAARIAIEGWERLEEARSGERPVLVLTAHCGNWELLGAALNCRGVGMKVLGRALEDEELDRLLLRLRRRFDTETLARGFPGAARKLLRTLRSGGALAILIDQDTKVEGTWVPFFGRPAYTPLAAAKLAGKHGAAVVPAFIERRADGSHLLRLHPALDLPEDPVAATALMTAVIEEQIRRVPEQWVWMHRRWRRPPGHWPLGVRPAS